MTVWLLCFCYDMLALALYTFYLTLYAALRGLVNNKLLKILLLLCLQIYVRSLHIVKPA